MMWEVGAQSECRAIPYFFYLISGLSMWKLWSQIIPSVVLAVEQNGVLFREVDYVAVKGSFEECSNARWKQFGLIKGFWTGDWEP